MKLLNHRRILILRRHTYPQETHVLRNITTLLEAGFQVELICLKDKNQPFVEKSGNLNIYRIPLKHKRHSLWYILWEYIIFFFVSLLLITIRFICFRPKYVEIDTMPDFIVFTAVLPKILGAQIVLYMFELMPEQYCQKYGMPFSHPTVRLIRLQEKLSTAFADLIVVYHELLVDSLANRGVFTANMRVIYNVPLEARYMGDTTAEPREPKKLYFIHHGLVTKHYGLQYLLQALKIVEDRLSENIGIELDIVGKGEYVSELKHLSEELGFRCIQVVFWGYVSDVKLVSLIKRADAGVLPLLIENLSPNKLFDLAYFGKPVICSRIRAIVYHFPERAILYFAKGDVADLAEKILYFINHRDILTKQLSRNITTVYKKISWKKHKRRYLSIYEGGRL